MKLQTKLLSSILAVGLTVALVGGSTMAWFTDTKTVTPPTFTAGTVTLDGTSSTVEMTSPAQINNLNPGDTLAGSFKIVNAGSKAVRIRVAIPGYSWEGDLSTTNITDFHYQDSTKWYSGGDGYMYYKDVLLGTMADGSFPAALTLDDRSITVSADALINGTLTDNAYQGKTLTVNPFAVESIQATNGAAAAAGWAALAAS